MLASELHLGMRVRILGTSEARHSTIADEANGRVGEVTRIDSGRFWVKWQYRNSDPSHFTPAWDYHHSSASFLEPERPPERAPEEDV